MFQVIVLKWGGQCLAEPRHKEIGLKITAADECRIRPMACCIVSVLKLAQLETIREIAPVMTDTPGESSC